MFLFIQRWTFIILTFFASQLAMSPIAQAALVTNNWGKSFVFQGSGGLSNPLLEIAFNPQPEPPNPGVVSSSRTNPVITHSNVNTGTPFQLLFGISGDSPLFIDPSSINRPIAGELQLEFFGGTDDDAFTVFLMMLTSSSGTPIDWVAFNPQPEPPRLGVGAASFGADFAFSSYSDVTLSIQVLDANGTPISLKQVPEPETVWLIGLGLIGYIGSRKKSAKEFALAS